VLSTDISQPALAAAARNLAHNRDHPNVAAAAHELLVGDAFMTLRSLKRGHRRFGLIVIDPPAFAARQEDIDSALHAYRRLARLGTALLRPGGALVIASCSSRVSAGDFFVAVLDAARQAGRPLTELARTGHGLDHPVSFKEGAYLKCLFARVT
jgi:23S rRNA (cytosine1962-C5)-methyltransferase